MRGGSFDPVSLAILDVNDTFLMACRAYAKGMIADKWATNEHVQGRVIIGCYCDGNTSTLEDAEVEVRR